VVDVDCNIQLASVDLLGAFQGSLKQVGTQTPPKGGPMIGASVDLLGAFQGSLKQVGSQSTPKGVPKIDALRRQRQNDSS
jgi:hypothetical protein